jgi:phosphoglycolate phosphatase-like HAD superfamily hydrolase
MKAVILVDLDGTLAYYDGWHGPAHIGHPIGPMFRRVEAWLADPTKQVEIFTARLFHDVDGQARDAIYAWCIEHFGRELPVTAVKDFKMVELWDDRAVQVEPNTGRRLDGVDDGFGPAPAKRAKRRKA